MSNHKSRLAKLQRHAGSTPDARRVELMKPSEILARCDELTAAGAIPTDEQRARIEARRQVVQ